MTTCETCNDTHSMSLRGSLVPCTRCPTPCQECRINGRGAYCAKTPCACACHSIVEHRSPTPTPAPGLDLDAVERAERAMTPGPWSMRRESHFVQIRAADLEELVTTEQARGVDVANAAGIVALRNSAPALIAEVRALRAAAEEREADMHARIRAGYDKTVADAWRAEVAKRDAEIARLTAELARVTECYSESHAAVGQLTRDIDAGREIDRQNVAEVNRLTAELAAARAVTADVCRYLDCAASDLLAVVTSLYESRARAISDATDKPATVGGLLATAPVGSIVEFWHGATANQITTRVGGIDDRVWLWRYRNPNGEWSPWDYEAPSPDDLSQPGEIVPADPNQRGPLPKGG